MPNPVDVKRIGMSIGPDLPQIYRSRFRAAKKDSLQEYCGDLETTNVASRLAKIVLVALDSVLRPERSWTVSSQEFLEIMLKTLFKVANCRYSSGKRIPVLKGEVSNGVGRVKVA